MYKLQILAYNSDQAINIFRSLYPSALFRLGYIAPYEKINKTRIYKLYFYCALAEENNKEQ